MFFFSVVLVAQSCLTVCGTHGLWPAWLLCPWDSPGKNAGVGCRSLLQGIFPTQQLNPGLLHCRQILYRLSYREAPKVAQSCPTFCDTMGYTVHGILQARILEWVAFPFSGGSFQPRDPAQVSHIAGRFLTELSHKRYCRLVMSI